ncbi:MAG: rhodanese-like domain-containing protein [Desulfuromonadaceae bacterium]|nr:rhodanese-like domain-containing protein [Desulfuromonadaceae bacterium]MDD2855430.1 rhodanese-like domain-containing protein [Desulfuromonadaceae bacterium]
MKKLIVIVGMLVMSLASAAMGEDFMYSDEVLDKIGELKVLAEAKKDMPAEFAGIKMVDVAEAYSLWKGKKVVFVDARPKAQFDTETIPGSIWLDSDKLLEDPKLANGLDKSKEYIIFCSGIICRRAPGGALELQAQGFKNVRYFRGGMPEWKAKGYPVK